jgi:hypothetical protein
MGTKGVKHAKKKQRAFALRKATEKKAKKAAKEQDRFFFVRMFHETINKF